MPRRATLVSAGKPGTTTRPGLYRILSKVRVGVMRGRVPEPYLAESVPWIMHFWQGQALHAAWWHDGFGAVRSHGCINLPPLDARWLFGFATPPLPVAWRGVLIGPKDPALWVLVEKRTPPSGRSASPPELEIDRSCIDATTGEPPAACVFDLDGPADGTADAPERTIQNEP